MNWYVLFVQTGKEETVRRWLNIFFSETTFICKIPKRRLPEKKGGKQYTVTRNLFPGYVFINTDMDIEKYEKIKSIPDIIKILNNGSYYSKVDMSEMSVILSLLNENDILDFSRIYVENSRVLVKSGPLCGWEGIIKKIDKHRNRAKIVLNLMGQPRVIDVGIELLYPDKNFAKEMVLEVNC